MTTKRPWPYRSRVSMAPIHSRRKKRPTARRAQHPPPSTPVSHRTKTMHEIPFRSTHLSTSTALIVNIQLHRKFQMTKTLHPPVAPQGKTKWRRRPARQTASSRSWKLLGKRSRMRPTTHVRSLKGPHVSHNAADVYLFWFLLLQRFVPATPSPR